MYFCMLVFQLKLPYEEIVNGYDNIRSMLVFFIESMIQEAVLRFLREAPQMLKWWAMQKLLSPPR